jgi:hypothetical protein
LQGFIQDHAAAVVADFDLPLQQKHAIGAINLANPEIRAANADRRNRGHDPQVFSRHLAAGEAQGAFQERDGAAARVIEHELIQDNLRLRSDG